jgi:hypothetical protein
LRDRRFFLPFAVAVGYNPLVLRCTPADWINIMVTKRVSWYKRLIELPAECADAPKLQGSEGRKVKKLKRLIDGPLSTAMFPRDRTYRQRRRSL